MLNSPVSEDRAKLFDILYTKAFFREKIILSSGKESDYYIDARRVTLSAPGAFHCAKIILDLIKDDKLDAIGGPTLGADPMVGAVGSLSHQMGKPIDTFIIRKAPKAHGKQQQLEGPLLPEKARVVLIDDVATTGKAFVESIQVLKPLGFEIVKAICIVDRGEGAGEALKALGVPLVSIYKIEEFLSK